ncbi:MAG: Sfum_1244 family protein [Burkholderiales bacterium]
MRNLNRLVDSVQRNCHVADARHARDTSLCIYLLQMREYYRWENDLPLEEQPRRNELGTWLTEREALWSGMEDAPFDAISVNGHPLDPFDAEGINTRLAPEGLVYGGGIGRFHRPHFFLARLERMERRDGLRVLVAGCEYARDLSAPPAVLHNDTVYLRTESVRRWLWDKVELWRMKKTDGALASALTCYGFGDNAAQALERMVEAETEAIILHELGESQAELLLGTPWCDMLGTLSSKRAELVARAVRDNLADCASTLPALFAAGADASIHFYFANFDGMRKALFPKLDRAYRRWRDGGELAEFADTVRSGRAHWEEAARRLLDIGKLAGGDAGSLDKNIEREEPVLAL